MESDSDVEGCVMELEDRLRINKISNIIDFYNRDLSRKCDCDNGVLKDCMACMHDALNWSCEQGHFDLVVDLATSIFGIELDWNDDEALKRACRGGHLDIVEWFHKGNNITIYNIQVLKEICIKHGQYVAHDWLDKLNI